MKFAIVSSKQDKAGMNITSFLPDLIPIHYVDCKIVHAENIDKKDEIEDADFIIFTSKHVGKKPKMLSLHAPGNWKQADYGGKEGKICKTSAFVLKYLFQEINKNAQEQKLEGYEVTMEVTHHGPLIEKPCCFIELGSSEAQWNEKEPAKVLAKTILSLQDYKENKEWIPCIAIGGPHYCPNFNKIQLNSKYAISHIIPEYSLPLTESMLKEAEQKTTEQIKQVILDWKGCGKSEERQKALEIIKKFGIEMKRTSDIEK